MLGQQHRDKILLAFSVGVIALSSLFYFIFQASGDPTRCKVVLEDGFWLNPDGLSNWQPAGCMMHTYRATEATSCLRGRRVVFIGGSGTRSLFEGFVKKFDATYKLPSLVQEANAVVAVSAVRFEFIWDPLLESAGIKEISAGYTADHSRPAMTVIGNALEFIRHDQNISTWVSHISEVAASFDASKPERSRQSDEIVMTPVLEPDMATLTEADRALFDSDKLDTMNEVLRQLSYKHGIDVAFAFNKVLRGPDALVGALHPVPKALAVMADILLNRRCNMGLPKHYPYASTCCNTYPSANWIQIFGVLFIAIFVPAAVYLHHKGFTSESSALLRLMPAQRYLNSILVMGLTVFLCYYCDRTNILGKEQKQTSPSQFFILMAIIIAGSLYTLKTSDKDLAFLNREQTDEWKGWMQVAILVYHYVGVSKTEYIYNYMRVCPTSYLFMTGFGHTCYFLKKGDYSFKRFVATMLRLNLLNVILAYAMGNDWLLYYFAPLVTWNFFVLFAIFYIGNKHNSNLSFLFGKMAVGAVLNAAFNKTPGVMELVWSVLQTLFRMQGDLREWRFRVTLDQYSMFPGMICGVLFLNWGSLALPKSPHWPLITKAIYAGSVVIMFGYAVFETAQPSKILYNQKHTYVSWLPCCAYVILRNATPWLRNTNNGFFAWVGSGSLETFLLQFHIWLAADTAGLLMVGPSHQRFINAIITTVLFLYIAQLVTKSTGTVIEWIMGAEPKPARPALPTSYKSHIIVPQANGEISNGVALNGQVADIKVQDPEKLAAKVTELESQDSSTTVVSTLSVAFKDLRVRVALVMGAMAVMNWTYYL